MKENDAFKIANNGDFYDACFDFEEGIRPLEKNRPLQKIKDRIRLIECLRAKGFDIVLNRKKNPEVCDATTDDSSTIADQINQLYHQLKDCPLKEHLRQWFDYTLNEEANTKTPVSYPRWVRASEPPKRDGFYCLRHHIMNSSQEAFTHYEGYWFRNNRWAYSVEQDLINYEWLDENPDPVEV